MSVPEHLDPVVRNLPTLPGCYLYYNAANDVIYVGKAVNLRNRVRSYFNESAWIAQPKTGRLVKEIARIEFVVRGSELEALIQEAELIKKHLPRFNILLKDDKRYPYLKVTMQDDFPTVRVTRKLDTDGARYYGPYSSAKAVYETRDTLRRMFPFLDCDRQITGQDKRACMYFDIKLCSGPCIGAIQRAEYRASIKRLTDFLDGHSDSVLTDLEARMNAAAEGFQYERAASYRDQLRAVQHVAQKQRIVSAQNVDQDVIAYAREEGDTCVQVLFIRGGKLLGQEHFVLSGAEGEDEAVLIENFVKRFYDGAAYVPAQVLLPAQIEESKIIERWLAQKSAHEVTLLPARNAEESGLVDLARQNATETLSVLRAQWQQDTVKQESTLKELQDALELPKLPTRIECFDISNTQGTAITAAMVVFVHGVPQKSHYRRFNIDSSKFANEGPNDFESMRQALTRRFARWKDGQAVAKSAPAGKGVEPVKAPGAKKKDDESFGVLPDLLLIDGGKGQLGIAIEVLKALDLFHIVPVASLAKQQEEIFLPGRPISVFLPRNAQSLFLVQRVRDEAHRYGITGHRRMRQKIGMASRLDSIPGIGPTRRKRLLTHFGSISAILAASEMDLARVVGKDVAGAIKGATI